MYENGRVVRQNITGNDDAIVPTAFPSSENRLNTLDTVAGQNNYGENGGFDFEMSEDDLPQMIEDPVDQFNSRLDLVYDMPSTERVTRYNSQNKGVL